MVGRTARRCYSVNESGSKQNRSLRAAVFYGRGITIQSQTNKADQVMPQTKLARNKRGTGFYPGSAARAALDLETTTKTSTSTR